MSDQPPVEVHRYQNLTAAFTDDSDHKQTSRALLIRQQLSSLFMKRVRILARRYVIAVCTLLLPVVLEAVLSAIIPSSAVIISDAINSFLGIRSVPPFTFDTYKYGAQVMPVSTNNDSSLYANFSAYMDRQAQLAQKPRNTLTLMPMPMKTNLDAYVYAQRKSDLRNLIGNYYFGLNMSVNASRDEIEGAGYFSTFPYHTSATLLNQIDSFLLAYYSKDVDRAITTVNAPVSVALVQNFTGINPNDLNFFTCIEGIPFSYLDMINGKYNLN